MLRRVRGRPPLAVRRSEVRLSRGDEASSDLERAVRDGEGAPSSDAGTKGPPPLSSFDLVLHRDGSWTHEGVPFRNRRLREKFDRSVRYLPDEDAYVVQIGRFRGLVEIEEVGFFVRSLDLDRGEIHLSDRSVEPLDVASLKSSPHDGALICRIKRDLRREGLPARFTHAAQAEFMNAVDEAGSAVLLAGEAVPIPTL
jgi:hypothetical protein